MADKIWQFDMNRSLVITSAADQAKHVLWHMKAVLTGQVGLTDTATAAIAAPTGLWTVVGSSDSLVGAMDGVDRWTSTFDASKIVYGAGAAVHSWIVLRSPANFPGGQVWLTLDFNGITANYSLTYFSYSAPTGGTTTARPTSTLETYSNSYGGTAPRQLAPATTSVYRVCGMLSTDGNFMFTASTGGSNTFTRLTMLVVPMDRDISDLYPAMHYEEFGANAGMAQNVDGMGLNASASNWVCLNHNGSKSRATALMPTTNSNAFTSWPTVANGVLDPVRGAVNALPVYVSTAVPVSGGVTFRGRIPDCRWIHAGFAGSVFPATGTPERMAVGHLTIPTNAAPIT